MSVANRIVISFVVLLFAVGTLAYFALGLYRRPQYIQNFEQEVYGKEEGFLEPRTIVNGLAIYELGEGEPVLLIPYPHGHTTEPMAQGPLAQMLIGMGRKVITFDVPGAYRSTRDPVGDMEEMIRTTDDTLDSLGIEEPVDVVGHSMSGFVALAYAVERPERVKKLVLANSVSGFPAAVKCGFPGSAFKITEPNYWRVILWGMRVNGGRGDLALHTRLQNLMQRTSYHDPSFFTPVEITEDDENLGIPIRMIWSRNMYRGLSYADRLGEVRAPTLVIAGRHDPEAGLACSQELLQGIPGARLEIFEESGHAPFIEEARQFAALLAGFLASP